jgi:hypothetical protein
LTNKLSWAWLVSLLALAVLVVAAGCGGGGTTDGGGTGQLHVRLADALDPDVTAVNVTIDRVEAHIDGRWQNVPVVAKTHNLLDLNENDVLLASAELPAGRYNQVRLFITDATVTDGTGTHNVTIPSAAQTGIKLNVNYDIGPNEVTVLLLDFNVAKSLIKQGNGQYRLQPVIPVVVKVLSGTITGQTVGADEQGLPFTNIRAIYTSGSSYPIGTEVNTAASRDDSGFKIWALLPGTYTLYFEHTDDEDNVTTATVENVVVSANQNTDVGVVVLN